MILLTEWIKGDKKTGSEREGGRSCDGGGSATGESGSISG
jgi:hypothetical protein